MDESITPPDDDQIIQLLVDFAMPSLPQYDFCLYLLLLRHTWLNDGIDTIRVGKRTLLEELGRGTRSGSSGGNLAHVSERLRNLATIQCIEIGDSDRLGTSIRVIWPTEVPLIQERIAASRLTVESIEDFYTDPDRRKLMFDRDGWKCRYCGDHLTATTATLDHIVPVSKGGTNDAANLASACLICNSIKAGRTYEEAAPQILNRLLERQNETTT